MIGKKNSLILKRYTAITDSMGGKTHTYVTVKTIKGVLATVRGDERLSADKLTVIADFNFYMDYPKGYTISESDKFNFGTRTFKIIYINNLGANQDKRLKITLKEEV